MSGIFSPSWIAVANFLVDLGSLLKKSLIEIWLREIGFSLTHSEKSVCQTLSFPK